MGNQNTITLKLTREEANMLIAALCSRKEERNRYIAVMEVYSENESFAAAAKQARAELPKLELLRNKIYAAELGISLQRYLSILDRAQKIPQRMGPASTRGGKSRGLTMKTKSVYHSAAQFARG